MNFPGNQTKSKIVMLGGKGSEQSWHTLLDVHKDTSANYNPQISKGANFFLEKIINYVNSRNFAYWSEHK